MSKNTISFTTVSIIGRVYFGIKGLEFYLSKENLKNSSWNWILDILWSYCEGTIKKGTWHYLLSEIEPKAILEDVPLELKGIEKISIEKYEELRSLYVKVPDVVISIFTCIFEIGVIELYGSIRNNSPWTERYCKELLEIFQENNIKIPDIEFLQGSFKDNEGWGYSVSRDGKILK